MKTASALVAIATALTFTSALAATELTTSGGKPVGSSSGNSIAVATPAGHVESTPAPVVEHKAPVKKAKKGKKAKKAAAKPAATTPAATPATAQ